ncbi:MAG TPA: CoA pyrophosphatase, partial [Balneolaceae bacterium]|nr:CoA pyrophosphatase [Balneolaceae bacterium]
KPLTEQGTQRPMKPVPGTRKSSVLVLFFPNERNEPSLVFTLRTSHINHGGQISFPGGRYEKGETKKETALREAREEIGINTEDIDIAGSLSDLFISVSDNLVTPIIGFIDYKPNFRLNPAEVAEVFTVPIEELGNSNNFVEEEWELQSDAKYNVPFWNIHHVPLWGATAMILSELMELYREFKSQQANDH